MGRMTIDADGDSLAAAINRPTVITILIALNDLSRQTIASRHSGVLMTFAARLSRHIRWVGGGLGVGDIQDKMLIMAVCTGGTVLDTERDSLPMDRADEFLRCLRVTFPARRGEVLAVDHAGRIARAFQAVNTMTIGADCAVIVAFRVAMNRFRIAGKADWQADVLGGDNALIAVTFAACLWDSFTTDKTGRVTGMFDAMPSVTIGAGCRRAVAVEPCEAVDARTVVTFDCAMASAATEIFRLFRIGYLMGAMTGETVHLALFKQWFVHRTDKLVAITGVALFTGGDGSFIEVRLVSRVDIVAGRARHRGNRIFVDTSFDLLHRPDVALFAQFIYRANRGR